MSKRINELHIPYKKILLYGILIVLFAISYFWVNHNHAFYERPIAKVIETTLEETEETVDIRGNEDMLFTQQITAEIQNGDMKDQTIYLTNTYSESGAYDQEYRPANEVFVSINEDSKIRTYLTGHIEDVKRDKHVLIVAWVFVLTLVLIGKKQGLFSVISLIINAIFLSYALDVYLHSNKIGLLLVSSDSVILFTVISLLIVNGLNGKTYAAIAATLLGTFALLLITYLVMVITSEKGLRYEEVQFLTKPPPVVFMAGVLIGSLGAVMDVAITDFSERESPLF